MKNGPVKYEQQKIKEQKYENKKKGHIKTVNQMTLRGQWEATKLWREKAKYRRSRLALQDISNAPVTPPRSENEFPPDHHHRLNILKSERGQHIKFGQLVPK